MSLKAKFKDSNVFSKMLQLPENIVKQIKIIVYNEKYHKDSDRHFSIFALEKNGACLVVVELAKSDFEIWECTSPKNTAIKEMRTDENGEEVEFELPPHYQLLINTKKFCQVLKRRKSEEELTLEYDPKKDKSKLYLKMLKKGATKPRIFNVALEKVADEEDVSAEGLEDLEAQNKCTLNYRSFDDALKDAEIFSEDIIIQTKKKSLIFKTESFVGGSELELEDEEVETEFNADVELKYRISYLKNVIKAGDIETSVELQFAIGDKPEESPLLAQFNYKESRIIYFIAANVEEEEDDWDDDDDDGEENSAGEEQTTDTSDDDDFDGDDDDDLDDDQNN
jgi:hypothetical protein